MGPTRRKHRFGKSVHERRALGPDYFRRRQDPRKAQRRRHGLDEHIAVKSLYEGQQFLYRVVKTLSTSSRVGMSP